MVPKIGIPNSGSARTVAVPAQPIAITDLLDYLDHNYRVSKDRGTLWLTQQYEDPQVFDGLAARYMAWTHRPGEDVYPYDCDPSYGR